MKKIIALLLIALLLLSGCAQKQETGAGLTDFSAVDLNGENRDESIYKGKKLTMINVWATYCGPCIQEMPALTAIAGKYADQGFQIVGIVTDVNDPKGTTAYAAREILQDAGASHLNLLPDQSMSSFLQGMMYVPTTVFVNEKGEQVGEQYVGSRDQAAWEEIILPLLEEVS